MPYNLSITWLPVEKTHDVVTSIQKSVVVDNDNGRNDNNHGTGVHLLLHIGRQIIKMYLGSQAFGILFPTQKLIPKFALVFLKLLQYLVMRVC